MLPVRIPSPLFLGPLRPPQSSLASRLTLVLLTGRLIPVASSSRMRPLRPRDSQHSRASGCGFHDAADDDAISKHVKVVVIPLPGGTRGRGAFEDQVVLVHVPRSFRWHFRHV